MAPSARSSHTELDTDGDEFDFGLQKTDRKVEGWLVHDRHRSVWVPHSYAGNFADPETSGGEEEASADQ